MTIAPGGVAPSFGEGLGGPSTVIVPGSGQTNPVIAIAIDGGGNITVDAEGCDGTLYGGQGPKLPCYFVYVPLVSDATWASFATLSALVNGTGTTEKDLEEFFRKNPEFLLQMRFQHAIWQVGFARRPGVGLRPDAILVPAFQHDRHEIVELKSAVERCFSDAGQPTSYFVRALRQAQGYRNAMTEEVRERLNQKYGLSMELEPTVRLVIGRRRDLNHTRWVREERGVTISFYDDILDWAEYVIRQVGGWSLKH